MRHELVTGDEEDHGASRSAEDVISLYRQMLLIREFEHAVSELYSRAQIPGIAHVSIGQEAVPVGVCSTLRRTDYITSTHRGHGHCLAKGASPNRMFAELFGRATGYCEGKGGSMHIADPATGNLGANAIVGGSFGIAVGAALSAKVLAAEQVSVCFFGDGAANQGLFLEAMNIASVWRLPCVFVCEDNQYGEYTFGRDVTAGQIAQRAIALKLPVYEADGMDVLDVQKVSFAAVCQARAEAGPQFVNCETYRYYGHGMSDRERAYRSRAEEASWRTRDPLERLERHIAEHYQLDVKKTSIHHDVSEEIAQAVEFARMSPVPRPESVSTNVYAS